MILEDSDNEEPEAAEDGQVNDINNSNTELTIGNIGGNSGNTGYEMGSTSHQNSSLGGVNEGSTSRTHQDNTNAESSRMNLLREMI